jgi:hypothetical protein
VVVPVPKKSGTINTLPTYEKILEAVVKKQLIEYLEKKTYISRCSVGFQKKSEKDCAQFCDS